MPELPEVETIVRDIAPLLEGRRILAAEVLSPLVVRHHRGSLPDALTGRRILEVKRHGKHIVIALDQGVLVVHLGMTGKLLFNAPQGIHTRAVFTLEDNVLVYEDIRMFGSLEWTSELPTRMNRLGPEPFDINPKEFARNIRQRRTTIKALLLNQGVIRGMGNIYTDEALWRAAIHPRASSARFGSARAARLHSSIVEVLEEAIRHRGSSVSDYVDAEGRKGGFQLRHNVYGKEGEPCPRCGTAIVRTVVAQRGTHYCPRCQRV